MSAEQVAVASQPAPTRVRVLPTEEWEKLAGLPIIAEMGTPSPEGTRIVVLEREDTNEIVGFWFLFVGIHVEPLWVHEDYRNRVGVVRRMWNGMRDLLDSVGARVAYAIVGDDALMSVAQQARRLGFSKVPGSLYYIDLKDAKLPAQGPAEDA